MNTSDDARQAGWAEHIEALRAASADPSTVTPRHDGESMPEWTRRARLMVLVRACEPLAEDFTVMDGIRHEVARLHLVSGTHGNLGSAVWQFTEKVALWLGQVQGTYHPQDVMAAHAEAAREIEARHWHGEGARGDADEQAMEAMLDSLMDESSVIDDGKGVWTASHERLQVSRKSAGGHSDALALLRRALRLAIETERQRRSA